MVWVLLNQFLLDLWFSIPFLRHLYSYLYYQLIRRGRRALEALLMNDKQPFICTTATLASRVQAGLQPAFLCCTTRRELHSSFPSSHSSKMRSYMSTSGMILGIFAALVAAGPSFGFSLLWKSAFGTTSPSQPETCMTTAEAHISADIFRQLIQEYSPELAMEALTEDFVDWASSVNILINKGAGYPKSMDAPTFASRAAFMDGQGKQPQIPFETIKVFPGCRHVAMRWKTGKSASGQKTEADSIV